MERLDKTENPGFSLDAKTRVLIFTMQQILWWLRRDLRLTDNVTLHYALRDAPSVIPLFILDHHRDNRHNRCRSSASPFAQRSGNA